MSTNREIVVIGAPYAGGQPYPGPARGPEKLREAGLVSTLKDMHYKVKDLGDLTFEEVYDDPPDCNIKHPRTTGKAMKQISDKVAEILSPDKLVLTLGGDHSIAIGSIHGHRESEPNLGIVWVDAHSDINPPAASPSGNIHGMPMAFLVKELAPHVPHAPPIKGLEWVKPFINAKDIAYIGLRDIDEGERYVLEEYGIKCFHMHEVDKLGIRTVVEQAIKTVNPNMDRPIHLSFDVDGLDPMFAPSTGTPVPGGLQLREGIYIVEELLATGKLSSIDLVEVNPKMGSQSEQDTTLANACELIAGGFGRRGIANRRGYRLPAAQ